MDLLTTCLHHSELPVITALSLISILYKWRQHPISLFQPTVFSTAVLWQRNLTVEFLQLPTLTSLLSGEYPATELFSWPPDFQLSTEQDRHLFSATLPELNSSANPQLTQSQSQNYFTTGGLPPTNLSWRQAPWDTRPVIFFPTEHLRLQSLCNILSDERMGLSFTITAGPHQCSPSRVRVPRDSWLYFIFSDSRLPSPGRSGPRIYILQEEGGPVILQRIGFPFRRLLRRAELRLKCSKPPPHGVTESNDLGSSSYSLGVNPTENTASNSSCIVIMGGCLATAMIFLICLPAVT
jgi:hypothetical protein